MTNLANKQSMILVTFWLFWNSLIPGKCRYGGGREGLGWLQRLKQRSKTTRVAGFRVAMMSIYTHNGPTIHYKAWTDMCWQWEQYQVPTTNVKPSICTISPVANLHGQQKELWKTIPVDISQWRQWTCIVIIVAISCGNKMNFSLCANMAGFAEQVTYYIIHGHYCGYTEWIEKYSSLQWGDNHF